LRLIARAEGVGYDALLKRRQRAEAALRRTLSLRSDVRKRPILDLISSAGSLSGPSRERAAGDRPDCASRDAA
jgi:hypothetical protein